MYFAMFGIALALAAWLTSAKSRAACGGAAAAVSAGLCAFDIGSDRVMDSTGALNLVDIPEKLLVIGGGYIGLEMGTVYAQLGSEVTVVEMAPNLLPGADPDLVKPLAKRVGKLCEGRVLLDTKVSGSAS